MKKLKMNNLGGITFEEGCNKYLLFCKERNLRDGTIRHYRQSYNQFYKYFEPETPLRNIKQEDYDKYVVYFIDTLHNNVSVNSYLRDLITTFHFLMKEDYMDTFEKKSIKVDAPHKETCTDAELRLLLKKQT